MKKDLFDLAKSATEEAGWDARRARVLLVKLLSDGSHLSEVTEEAVYFAADQLLRDPAHRERSGFWQRVERSSDTKQVEEEEAPKGKAKQAASKPAAEKNSRATLRAYSVACGWVERYRIRGNKPLLEATAEDLTDEIAHARMTAVTAVRNERFYSRLLERLEGDETVRDAFTNEEIVAVASECRIGVES